MERRRLLFIVACHNEAVMSWLPCTIKKYLFSVVTLGLLTITLSWAQTFEPVSDPQGQTWLETFDRLYISDLDQARDSLNRVRQRADETNDPELMVAYAQRIIDHFRYSDDPTSIVNTLTDFRARVGESLTTAQDLYLQLTIAALHVQSQIELDEAEALLLSLDQTPEAQTFRSMIKLQLGNLYQTTGQYPRALEFYTQALRGDERLEFQARVYNNLGNVAGYLEDWAQSIDHYRKAIDLYESLGMSADALGVLANLGPTYRSAGRLDDALETYQKALDSLSAMDSPDLEAQIQMNLGNLYVNLGQSEAALTALNRSLAICETQGYGFCVMLNHLNIGYVHYVNKDYDKALAAYGLTSQDLENIADPYIERQLMKNYSDLYRDLGDFEKALEYAERYQILDRQLINAEAKASAEVIQTRFETELKDAQLAIQAAQIERQQVQLRLGIFLALGLVTVLGIVISALSFRARALQSLFERNQDLLLQNDVNQRIGRQPKTGSSIPASGQDNESSVSAGLEQVFDRLTQALQDDELYRDPNLSLGDLASHVASNSTYVSNAISHFANTNFNNLVNYYRIMDARRQLNLKGPSIQISDLVHSCGFNSKASFYRAFSKYVGMSPSQYLQRLKVQRESLKQEN